MNTSRGKLTPCICCVSAKRILIRNVNWNNASASNSGNVKGFAILKINYLLEKHQYLIATIRKSHLANVHLKIPASVCMCVYWSIVTLASYIEAEKEFMVRTSLWRHMVDLFSIVFFGRVLITENSSSYQVNFMLSVHAHRFMLQRSGHWQYGHHKSAVAFSKIWSVFGKILARNQTARTVPIKSAWLSATISSSWLQMTTRCRTQASTLWQRPQLFSELWNQCVCAEWNCITYAVEHKLIKLAIAFMNY